MTTPIELTSLKNPHIMSARELASRKGRQAQRAFLCEGEHMVLEALTVCPDAVRHIFVESEKYEKYQSLLAMAHPETAIYAITERMLASISQVKTPQGIAATVALPQPAPLNELGDKLVLLENVQDPGNVGTILRTLDAAGFSGCILTHGCADPFAPKTLRATMGSIFRVPMLQDIGAEEAMQDLKKQGYALLAAELSGEPFYQRSPLPDRLCLLIGNEGAGLTPAACRLATHRFSLPMRGGAESLNAAVAAAIMMYDIAYGDGE